MATPLIPRIFHFIWVGQRSLPADCRRWMDTWRTHHPGWEHRLWTDANRPPLRNEDVFQESMTAGQRADVLRYELLLRYGGVYVDTDIECLRSIEPLLDGVDAFTADEGGGRLCNAIMGAVPGHAWVVELVELLPASFRREWLVPEQTGPGHLTRVTAAHRGVTIFPPGHFYPYAWDEPERACGPFPQAYGVHHWTASWVQEEHDSKVALMATIRGTLERFVNPAERAVVVDEGLELGLPQTLATPLIGRDGWWAPPASGVELRRELERLRSEGHSWLVLLQPAYWWLDEYPDVFRWLGGEPTVQQPGCMVFRLPADTAAP